MSDLDLPLVRVRSLVLVSKFRASRRTLTGFRAVTSRAVPPLSCFRRDVNSKHREREFARARRAVTVTAIKYGVQF